ncbi:MAG: Holliday junction resolvase RuvX [Candidatus Peregrinibacteria bacterium]
MKILAIDYGEKRVGLAVGNTDLGIAFPRGILENTENLLPVLAQFCQQEKIDRIILGYPLPLSGERGAHIKKYESFADDAEDFLRIPVELYCERFSSKTAGDSLSQMGESSRKQRGKKDDMAAAIFLQEYMRA